MEDLKKLKNRIDWFCENKVNAFSPTISPAPKSSERKEIESIDKAVRYFFDNGVKEIVVERKYMGSYCDIYLCKNLDDTYFVSRNGHKMDHIDIEAAKNACKELHARFDWTNLHLAIIQSELMPWSVLGQGLIENEFGGYLNVHQNHYEHLADSDLYGKVAEVKDSEAYKTFIEDKNTLSLKELKTKYPHHIIRQYESLSELKLPELNVYKQSIDIYEAQINHFGKQEDIFLKPFNILKKVFDDGTEEFVNDNLSYKDVNDDEFLHLPINNEEELNDTIEKVYFWFAALEQDNEEGIVIKPRQAFIKGIPPAFKVRNNQYLTMIYGVNFHDRYGYYLYKRNISKKLECSINDWTLNRELLSVPYNEINKENYFFKNLVLDRILGEKAEAGLDVRL